MSALRILSGGAANGLVTALAHPFAERTGLAITGEFGAVGTMADLLRTGTPADLVILTSALVATLAGEGLVLAASARDVGLVETGLAIRSGDPAIAVTDAAQLRDALLAADAIFVPDTRASTAGIHIAKVLHQLGIASTVASRLHEFPNGATAMRQLAQSRATRPIGCTQATEIISTNGVQLSGMLPKGCDLATMYTAAITTTASANRSGAQALIDLLTDPGTAEVRTRAGFSMGSDRIAAATGPERQKG